MAEVDLTDSEALDAAVARLERLRLLHVALLRRRRCAVARGELTPPAQTRAPTGIVRVV
jgi:hypothetical protein